jgi:hypothetical protein
MEAEPRLHSGWPLELSCIVDPDAIAGSVRDDSGAASGSRATRSQAEPGSKPIFNEGERLMGKSQDAKKSTKKPPTKTPKEKKEAKRLKKAARG